jgi:hypothetical protein
MRRLARIPLNFATALSLVLFLATVAAWSGLAPRSGHARLWRVGGGWVLEPQRYTAILITAHPHQVDEGWQWADADARRANVRDHPVGIARSAAKPVRTGAYEVVQYAAWAPPWLWALATMLLPAVRAFVRRKPHRIADAPGPCPTCGYDLRATPSRCPECGAVPADAAKTAAGPQSK